VVLGFIVPSLYPLIEGVWELRIRNVLRAAARGCKFLPQTLSSPSRYFSWVFPLSMSSGLWKLRGPRANEIGEQEKNHTKIAAFGLWSWPVPQWFYCSYF